MGQNVEIDYCGRPSRTLASCEDGADRLCELHQKDGGQVDDTRNQKLFRFLTLILVASAILWFEHPLSRILQSDPIAHVATTVAALACIPILYRIWRVGEEKRPSFGKWAIFLAVLSVGLTAIHLTSSWKDDHPRLYFALYGWALPIATFLACLAIILRGPKKPS
jgi:peptidoglycan/LPS O-acetylase OafA/YrhL